MFPRDENWFQKGIHSLRIYPYPMVWPLPRPWCETMVAIPLWAQKTQNPRKGARKLKLSKSVENIFDDFWRFLTFFALREKYRKVSKIFLTLFDDFWRFLTWPLSAGHFCGPLKNPSNKGFSGSGAPIFEFDLADSAPKGYGVDPSLSAEAWIVTLDGPNRQSAIAIVHRTHSTLAGHSAGPCGTNTIRGQILYIPTPHPWKYPSRGGGV